MKRTISLLLSFVMIITMTTGASLTAFAEAVGDKLTQISTVGVKSLEINPMSIIEGTNGYSVYKHNEITDEYDFYYFDYTPEETMEYTVTWNDGTVTSGSGYYLAYKDDIYWFDIEYNQSYENQWTQGNTYTMTVSLMGVSVDVPVTITKTPVKNIEIEPISIIEGTAGGYDTDYNEETGEYDLTYYRYEPEDIMEYTITWDDGTVTKDSNYYVEYQGEEYWFDTRTNQSYENQWTAGNTYNMTVYLLGVSVDVPVTIRKSPIKSIEIEPISVIEGTQGYIGYGYNEETDEYDLPYYYYSPNFECIVTWDDGSVTKGNSYYVEYEGKHYWYDDETDQSYENQWTVGNTYTITVSLMGISVDVPVTITKSPIKSIEIEPITIIKGTQGKIDYGYNEETDEYDLPYYEYEPEYIMEYTITWDDGTVTKDSYYYVEYKDKEYSFIIETDQSYENQWTVGNTYTMTASLMGVSVDVPVTITKSPVKSITIEPISIIESTEGYIETDYNLETGDYDLFYFYYQPENVMEYTITWNDGSVTKDSGYNVEYKDENYWFDIEYYQSYENQWTQGNTYTMTASLMGVSIDVPVTITKSPIKNIAIKPISIIQGTEGYYDLEYNEETDDYDLRYFRYEPEYIMEYTITWDDGTVTKGSEGYVEYKGQGYWIRTKTDQLYENQWTVGNTYTMTVSLMGVSVDVPVTITKAPIKNIAIKPISITEGTCGFIDHGYNELTDDYDLPYFYYEPEDIMEYTITWDDGSVTKGSERYVEYKGQEYWINIRTNQSYENQWTQGNTYTMTATLMGVSVDVPVTITKEMSEGTKLGDVDGNGKVTIMDATEIQRHLAELTVIDDESLKYADTDKNGKVTIMDATQIQRFLAELIPEL